MGLFDFLKPKRFEKAPGSKRAAHKMEFQYVQKQVQELRAVGRESDVNQAIAGFLRRLFEAWKKTPSDPSFLRDIADTSGLLGAPQIGKYVL